MLQMTKLLLPRYESKDYGNIQNYVELLHADNNFQNKTTKLKIYYNDFSLNSKQKTDPHVNNEELTISINDIRNNDKKIL